MAPVEGLGRNFSIPVLSQQHLTTTSVHVSETEQEGSIGCHSSKLRLLLLIFSRVSPL